MDWMKPIMKLHFSEGKALLLENTAQKECFKKRRRKKNSALNLCRQEQDCAGI